MKTISLVVDERELSTIQAALLLLQEQISALPEDLADMMSELGPAMTEKEIGKLSRRLNQRHDPPWGHIAKTRSPKQTAVEVQRSSRPAAASD
jgi:hypothetical protein